MLLAASSNRKGGNPPVLEGHGLGHWSGAMQPLLPEGEIGVAGAAGGCRRRAAVTLEARAFEYLRAEILGARRRTGVALILILIDRKHTKPWIQGETSVR